MTICKQIYEVSSIQWPNQKGAFGPASMVSFDYVHINVTKYNDT